MYIATSPLASRKPSSEHMYIATSPLASRKPSSEHMYIATSPSAQGVQAVFTINTSPKSLGS